MSIKKRTVKKLSVKPNKACLHDMHVRSQFLALYVNKTFHYFRTTNEWLSLTGGYWENQTVCFELNPWGSVFPVASSFSLAIKYDAVGAWMSTYFSLHRWCYFMRYSWDTMQGGLFLCIDQCAKICYALFTSYIKLDPLTGRLKAISMV